MLRSYIPELDQVENKRLLRRKTAAKYLYLTNFDDIYKEESNMSVKEKKNNGGFSLVELIVVIAISVVLIGAAKYLNRYISIRSVIGC